MGDEQVGPNWAGTTASVDQTLAALREVEYDIMRFQEATLAFATGLVEQGISRVQAANIIHGMALAAIFPDDE